jgi:hypothetical protein
MLGDFMSCSFIQTTGSRAVATFDADTFLRGLLAGLRLPLFSTRWATVISAAAQRRQAVARDIPKRQQIGFQRTFSARSHTIRASSGSSHESHVKVSSMRDMASGVGGICGMRAASQPNASW